MSGAEVLLVEDTPSLQLLYASMLRSAGHKVRCASTAGEGYTSFIEDKPPVVVLDLMLPDRDGLELMRELVMLAPGTAVIVVTSNGSINRAVEAMRAGAHDFLVKPFDEARMLAAVRNALETQHLRAANRPARPPTGEAPKGFAGFVGSSPAMIEVYARIRSVAGSMATVFVTGESGTGKELCAQAVHQSSGRARGPFVPLNCAAIPSELLESEVFGHLKGAFTGAVSDKIGAATAADGGTLFLDEVCELPLPLQTKMLRFLQTSTVHPVGATHPRKINVRIICASNRNPLEEVRAGRFREDLYYRLHVIPIQLPPLRDRGDDVLRIAEEILHQHSREEGKHFSRLSPEVQALFRRLPWPGNVRQLQNALRHVVVLHDADEVTLDMLPEGLAAAPPAATPSDAWRRDAPADAEGAPLGGGAPRGEERFAGGLPSSQVDLRGKTLAEIERLAIEQAIRRNGGSIPKAARELGVSPSTIYRKREGWT